MTETTPTRPNKASDEARRNPPTLTIDWDLYGQYLEDSDLSDAEKREFIEVLWSIVVSFVDLGIGIHPAQLATKDACEQNAQKGKSGTPDSASVVNCLHTPSLQASLKDFTVSAKRCSDASSGASGTTTKERSRQ